MPSDYRRGWEDHAASMRAQEAALKGPDRTLYECIGGPKHGERIETGGGMFFRVMLEPSPVIAYSDVPYNSYASPFRTGEYKREVIGQNGYIPRGRTVYVWQGER